MFIKALELRRRALGADHPGAPVPRSPPPPKQLASPPPWVAWSAAGRRPPRPTTPVPRTHCPAIRIRVIGVAVVLGLGADRWEAA
jgi:hypothetical protein